MQSHPLEQYLAECRVAHSTRAATPETAYYAALADLLNAAGKPLDVRVHCVMGLKDQGAGMPDGGLFTPNQFSNSEARLYDRAGHGTPQTTTRVGEIGM
jgi:hypothetical protein